ncbi:hypothetical protein BAUCODRAFT_23856 [Baudoinia panamericana UAMH 10762]|uniref:Uncharacterized protein n=1 Tax=Baudoinia panamericana (strain UAMH 10762) TaxID=717646 RepID=M2NED6_BAUPA|nr:uncharacterized protein BAUCODRAFT_23856 [Baudoinia panamericana UAMH 10762]EMC97589.1 hypothetical protein BAUCODRAFT_23856 [Baudoinia panamericana UAMH 10762]
MLAIQRINQVSEHFPTRALWNTTGVMFFNGRPDRERQAWVRKRAERMPKGLEGPLGFGGVPSASTPDWGASMMISPSTCLPIEGFAIARGGGGMSHSPVAVITQTQDSPRTGWQDRMQAKHDQMAAEQEQMRAKRERVMAKQARRAALSRGGSFGPWMGLPPEASAIMGGAFGPSMSMSGPHGGFMASPGTGGLGGILGIPGMIPGGGVFGGAGAGLGAPMDRGLPQGMPNMGGGGVGGDALPGLRGKDLRSGAMPNLPGLAGPGAVKDENGGESDWMRIRTGHLEDCAGAGVFVGSGG